MLSSSLVALSLLGADKPTGFSSQFCSAWANALKSTSGVPPSREPGPGEQTQPYERVLLKTIAALGQEPETANVHLETLLQTSSDDHLKILRGIAGDLGTTFECETYEYPAGRPSVGKPLLILQDENVVAIAADATGLYWLSCYQRGDHRRLCDLMHLEGGAPKVLAKGLSEAHPHTELVLEGREALVTLRGTVIAIPKAGGARKVLADGLTEPHALTVDGQSLLFADSNQLWRVPRQGGKPAPLVEGKIEVPGSTNPVLVVPLGQTVLFSTWQGPLFSVKAAGGPRSLPSTPIASTTPSCWQAASTSRRAASSPSSTRRRRM
jgi:hypothetical protein